MHTRREFLARASAVAAAAASLGATVGGQAAADAAGGPPQLFHVGYQIFSWGRYFPSAWWEAARECAAIGFPGIEGENTIANLYAGREPEFSARMRQQPERLAAIYSTTDLDISSQFYVNRYKNLLAAKFAQPQGTKVLVIGGTEAQERTPAHFVEYARQANAIGKEVLETTGLQVGVHPHLGSLVQHRDDIRRVMDTTDPRYFNLCPDVGHLAGGGMDPTEIVKTYASRVIHLHLKDWKRPVPGQLSGFAELGTGEVDFPALVRELKTIGFHGWADVELDGAIDPAASARRNMAYLTKVLHLRVGNMTDATQ